MTPEIDAELARRLVARQFPRWADLPVVKVEPGGVDNRTFRLGEELSLRLPAGPWYAQQVEKEQRWLPRLAPQLPLEIPAPVARGEPGDGYPYPWSVYRWIEGDVASEGTIGDLRAFATDVAGFLVALRDADTGGGPAPGEHNFHRGGPLATYAEETERALATLGDGIPRDHAARVWEDAMAATWHGDPVWFHGDVAAGNLLVRGGRLAAVIDFGSSGFGDPACDVVLAWTLLGGPAREAFRSRLDLDAATWSRGRGWGLWKALISLAGALEHDDAAAAALNRRVLDRILADHAAHR